MKEYELWLILMDISNYEKVKLIEKYNNEENIYNNIDNIINDSVYLARMGFKKIYINYGIPNVVSEYDKNLDSDLKSEIFHIIQYKILIQRLRIFYKKSKIINKIINVNI